MLKRLAGPLWAAAVTRLIEPEVTRRVTAALAETDNTFTVGWRTGASSSERDRLDYDREQVLELALEAWRTNPLARRIVELTSQYAVGGGLRSCTSIRAGRYGTRAGPGCSIRLLGSGREW